MRPLTERSDRGGTPKLSLFFFDANPLAQSPYGLLMEATELADRNGLHAVWTPERHFREFGGLHPNPAVLSAALAVRTERIHIRGGSVVLPLHDPLRVVEEWSVVDNLSNGRVGISFASGWHPADFVLSTDAYSSRNEVLLRRLSEVRRIWSGADLLRTGPGGEEVKVRAFPPPVQKELPVWITSSGSERTWESAARAGANILTMVGAGLESDVRTLEERIVRYRQLRRSGRGTVTLALHAYVGAQDEDVRRVVRDPLAAYLARYIEQGKGVESRSSELDSKVPSTVSVEARARFAVEAYLKGSTFLGSMDRCLGVAERFHRIGVDEIACLIDFGVRRDLVIESLARIVKLGQSLSASV